MLRHLAIRDLLIIDRLDLEVRPGLNVLTGETGAGKSILLEALGFVLGWRGRAELVRAGAAQGEVTAEFRLADGHPATEVLAEAGIALEEGELILRRVNAADGRKTAWVNGVRVSGDVLRQLSERLVELHGQQDDRGLLNPRGHRLLLDAFGGLGERVDAVRRAWRARRAAVAALAEAEEARAALEAEEEFLRHAAGELGDLAPEAGEAERLDAERRLMQAAERIRGDVGRAHAALTGEGAEGLITDAIRWLDDAAEAADGRLDAPLEALARAMDALGEAEQGVADCLDALAGDPRRLEAVEERLFAIRALARKHGVAPDELPALAADFAGRLAALDGAEGDIAALRDAAREADAAYETAAAALTEARRAAGTRLSAEMAGELAPLKLERAVFSVEVAGGEPGPEGRDDVAFVVATNPGAPAGPLNRIASGGELSRFLLALKVCLTRDAQGLTLIFDEIDRGVGGATADAVGRRLTRLAADGQVLVVTHSPQVAARAAHHWRVEKASDGAATVSRVVPLDESARIDEIARMLSGDTVTEAARGAARELLQDEAAG
ncbi:DNA repair protein RecN [Wenxinia marina]|uniref:DNA repair protein RecN n=1 Tax=Wenxinia marina DSM 24838 TaxID=1123501 RepID=A0A0D0QCA8_9RHOB|nr:DNA repair protein RecN [Wenxinia marina]KIQ68583.1 DNA replication and repair protein RecN [Wenxinia marina DSM 24838]GGL67068.1 DNA repair protein RecN [Wenxinia marina]